MSIFLSHLALDKKHYTFPLGKNASHVTMRCLFFYGDTDYTIWLATY